MSLPKLGKPLVIRRVQGHSMEPLLRQGQIVIASSLKPSKPGDIVIAELTDGREVVKRLHAGGGKSFSLVGDNSNDTTDYKKSEISKIYGGLLWPRQS